VESLKAAQQETRRGEDDERECHLRGDERAARPLTMTAGGPGASTIAETRQRVAAHEANRGDGAASDGDECRHDEREHDDGCIDVYFGEARNLRRTRRDEEANRRIGDSDPEN
jgi:hypothetical protein